MSFAAITFAAYGSPDALALTDHEDEQPGPGQVRVAVTAAGVQPFDCSFRRGDTRQWMPARFPQRLGNEFAGVIDALGDEVGDLAIGDEVLGWALLACYAEHVIVSTDQLVAKPPGMSWAEAGVLAASGQTAHTALEELGVRAGDTVLIHAAAGGVGSFAVQLARAWGATVVGTASPANHDYLRSLGAIPVTYGHGLTERVRSAAPHGVGAALDAAGSPEALPASLKVVTDPARVATIAFNPAADRLGVRRLSTQRSRARLTELTRLYSQAKLRIAAHGYPMTDAAEAHRQVETGHVRGKIVLIVGEQNVTS